MAAAIVPLVLAAAPLLTPIIKSLVMQVEHLFGAKTGPTKLDALVNALLPLATSLATAGKIPGSLDQATITAFVESVVSSLKAAGVLNPDVARIVAAQPITVSTGNLPATDAQSPFPGKLVAILVQQ